jgi:hypothetical protein
VKAVLGEANHGRLEDLGAPVKSGLGNDLRHGWRR